MEYFQNLFTAYTIDKNFIGYNFIDSLWIYPEKNILQFLAAAFRLVILILWNINITNFLCCWDFYMILLFHIGCSIPCFIFPFCFCQYYDWWPETSQKHCETFNSSQILALEKA